MRSKSLVTVGWQFGRLERSMPDRTSFTVQIATEIGVMLQLAIEWQHNLLQDEYSKLPKEIRDEAADYIAGHFDRRDFEEKSRANDQVRRIFVDFALSHPKKYPIASTVFALNNIDGLQAHALQCIATDDPRLKP